MDDKSILIEIREELHAIKEAILYIPRWLSITDIAKDKGISPQAIRQKLISGNFEPEVDFKYIGAKIYVAREALHKIKREKR